MRKEKEDRRRRERNVVWRGIEEEDREERRCFIIEIMWKVLGRIVRLKGIEERRGKTGRWVLLVEMEEIANKEEVLERGKEIGRRWGVEMDEDLSMGERRMRWRMVEAARKERTKRKRTVVTNRDRRIEGRRWHWDERRMCWKEGDEKDGGRSGRRKLCSQERVEQWRVERRRVWREREESRGRSELDWLEAWGREKEVLDRRK